MNNRDLHYLLLVSQYLCNRRIVSRTNKLELLPGQPKILEFLLEHDGCSQKEIGEGCLLDKSTVTSLIPRMEGLELIAKHPDPEDGRVFRISLTPKGRRLASMVRGIVSETDRLAWKGIKDDEREAFILTMQKIIENLKEAL
ncbi:MAG TPA: MarR family transcriptional regulator [Candidatus Copromorpha excrementigallinarum]|uniref:MarR family transcriptional regulator n=1 Tax=Candidatus Allocopromorpha excrementigallinarum TaxID=2840742 RepID=A0A9D1HZB3_9FIRM|nr:MarR family transcriptional regulator [Candidatus Copromorpha excrementigallinarum]